MTVTCQQRYEDKLFVVIIVSEFSDIPILCTKTFDNPLDKWKPILKERNIYVRTANAASEPLGSVDDLRTLIGLAVKKQGGKLIDTMNAILKGRPPEDPPADVLFGKQIERVVADLGMDISSPGRPGGWCIQFHPGKYVQDRWHEPQDLEALARRTAIRTPERIPAYIDSVHPREWGIASDKQERTWAFTYAGLFVCYMEFFENRTEFLGPYSDGAGGREPRLPPGKWIDYESSIHRVVGLFAFMSRVAAEYDSDGAFVYTLSAGPLYGRSLVTGNPQIFLGTGEPILCKAREFSHRHSLTVAALCSDWKEECAKALRHFFNLFPHLDVSIDVLLQWIGKLSG